MKILLVCAAALALPAAPAAAQPSAAPLVVGAAPAANVLRAGTEIKMVTRGELNSRRSRVGDRFELEVSEDVTMNGQTVIPAGSVATGEVTRRRGKGMWGKSGILETRLLNVRVGDQTIRITGQAGDRGRAGTAGVVAAVVALPIAGFFVTGTSAVIAPGTATVGYLESDLPVHFVGDVRPAGLVVPVQPAAEAAPAPVVQPQP
ncbi:MAG TPA: hypothetical protein VGB79_12235 [Allosphingosinicella sp.]